MVTLSQTSKYMMHKNIIICGPSRAGKTTLAKLANAHSKGHKGLIFEGLFPAYFSRLSYIFKNHHNKLFNEYMIRPRFIDEEKSKTITPAQQLNCDKFIYKGSFLASLNNAFGDNWIIADLHAELYYKTLLRSWPDIHFCVVIRDPRECVCAGIYWQNNEQNFPNAHKYRKKLLYKKLFSWILSVHTAKKIQKDYPDNITIINFNQVKNNDDVLELLELNGTCINNLPFSTYYSFTKNGLFTTPNHEKLELLTSNERAIIQNLCTDIMKEHNYSFEKLPHINIKTLDIAKTMIIGISAFSPSLARGFIDALFFPKQHAKNQLNRFKQFIKDIRNF